MRGELYFLLCSNFWLFNFFFFLGIIPHFLIRRFTRDRVCVCDCVVMRENFLYCVCGVDLMFLFVTVYFGVRMD